MECTVRWQADAGMAFVAETGSGHLLTMDGAPDGGGRNLAPRPVETVLAGTGGCTAYDVVLMNGGTTLRSWTATTPSLLYPTAQQVADFGSLPTSLTVTITQRSALVGPGNTASFTISVMAG